MKIKPPHTWLALFTGDMIISRIPKHKIDRLVTLMAEKGFELSVAPIAQGYLVTCKKSPNDDRLARN